MRSKCRWVDVVGHGTHTPSVPVMHWDAFALCRREQELQVEERENQFVLADAMMVGAERRLNSAALSKAGAHVPAAAPAKGRRRG